MNFRTNIKLSFEQWKFRKLQFIFLTVQIILSFLLVCFIFQQFFSNRQLMSQMQKYMGKGDIYVLWNNNEPEWEQELEKDKYNRKFRELINKVRTTNVDILVLNNEYETSIKEKVQICCILHRIFLTGMELPGIFLIEKFINCFVRSLWRTWKLKKFFRQ